MTLRRRMQVLNFKRRNPDDLDLGGTALRDTLDIAPVKLAATFGEPEEGSDKTSMEWWFEGSDGECYGLWDYYQAAEGDIESPDAVTFTVGAHDNANVAAFKAWVIAQTEVGIPF